MIFQKKKLQYIIIKRKNNATHVDLGGHVAKHSASCISPTPPHHMPPCLSPFLSTHLFSTVARRFGLGTLFDFTFYFIYYFLPSVPVRTLISERKSRSALSQSLLFIVNVSHKILHQFFFWLNYILLPNFHFICIYTFKPRLNVIYPYKLSFCF
jgi:hypothetical protein